MSLAMAAAVTDRIKLCTGITLVPERNPLILAKQISVLDRPQQRGGSCSASALAGTVRKPR